MMKRNCERIKKILAYCPELRPKLFARGFLFTDAFIDDQGYPFYHQWSKTQLGKYNLLVSREQNYYIHEDSDESMILVGHAYNPFSMCEKEEKILETLTARAFLSDEFWKELNCLTGIFTLFVINRDGVYIIGDPTCMQTTFYCLHQGHFYVSSHTNMLGDILELSWDEYVKKLTEYRFFPLLGNCLPGNITQFEVVKRLVPNHYICFDEKEKIESKRFYWPKTLDMNVNEIVEKASDTIHNNLELIANKWERPAISMTGGCDSKTTLACANGLYDKFSYFSYVSSESENVDAEAAHEICSALKLEHDIYEIPEEDNLFKNIEEIRAILEWNTGAIIPVHRNDVRKRVFFSNRKDFDVEVKSWASEIGRAYYSKRFNGRKKFGDIPTPRKCTTLYKFFIHNRKLVKATDKDFEEYLKQYFEQSEVDPVEWQEQFFWEFRMASWNGLVITGEHRYSFDITIPYNNRMLLELLLSADIEERIADVIYEKIRAKMNLLIDETGIAITNLKHTKNREKAENIYYILHSNILF